MIRWALRRFRRGVCRTGKKGRWASRRLKTGIYIRALNERLRGHYNYYNNPGNLNSLCRFYSWAVTCSFKWLNRRGGKRKSFTWAAFNKAIDLLRIAKPEMKIVNRRHRVFA